MIVAFSINFRQSSTTKKVIRTFNAAMTETKQSHLWKAQAGVSPFQVQIMAQRGTATYEAVVALSSVCKLLELRV